MEEQLHFVGRDGLSYGDRRGEKPRKRRTDFDGQWQKDFDAALDRWGRCFSPVVGTPVSVVRDWLEKEAGIHMNVNEVRDALWGRGYPVAMKLKTRYTGAAEWVVRPKTA